MSRLYDTLRARLGPRVRRLLTQRGAATATLQADLDDFHDQLSALESRVRGVEESHRRLHADEALWSQPFTGAMTIDQAWRRHPDARAVFASVHLPSCDTCAVRFDETIAEAAGAYGLDEAELLAALNDLIAGS